VILISTSLVKKAVTAYLEDSLDYLTAQECLNDEDDKVVSCDELEELVGLRIEHKSSVTVCRSTVM